jgi:hypothetical protein
VNSSKYHESSALAREPAYRVSAEGVAGMDTDSHDIARIDRCRIQGLYCFVAQNRITELLGSGGGKDEKPSWGDDGCAKRCVAGINYMDSQATASAGTAA